MKLSTSTGYISTPDPNTLIVGNLMLLGLVFNEKILGKSQGKSTRYWQMWPTPSNSLFPVCDMGTLHVVQRPSSAELQSVDGRTIKVGQGTGVI